ncbi:hypothetical protein RJ639_042183 [Escallonia herrerae]|uniref:Clp ATPase C-terminal domain-containing protein n=1 Tax=Escallonia herrerae TaxID=1293975 RepID=A0AA89B3T6_9ASTE|nr:hypothetical protein RJ639_042183 [Escallonia herrerae]
MERKNKAGTEAGERIPLVTEDDIQQVVSSWTGIPVKKASMDESIRLLQMEETLHKRVIGQDEAVKAISCALRRARLGLKNPDRPTFFLGQQTELAKSLASCYFGSEDYMIRLDMSEYMERHTVAKLIGSPPGYVGYSEGGQLTGAIRRCPHSLILFDEIEKAHSDVLNLMLQILEGGRFMDSKGRVEDLKNAVIIMTSTVGSSVIQKRGRLIGFDLGYDEKDTSYSRIKSLLTGLQVKEIADIMLSEVCKRLKSINIKLQVVERFKDTVAKEGYDPKYGARRLRRALMRLLEHRLAERILTGEIRHGDSVILDANFDGSFTVNQTTSKLPHSNLLGVFPVN